MAHEEKKPVFQTIPETEAASFLSSVEAHEKCFLPCVCTLFQQALRRKRYLETVEQYHPGIDKNNPPDGSKDSSGSSTCPDELDICFGKTPPSSCNACRYAEEDKALLSQIKYEEGWNGQLTVSHQEGKVTLHFSPADPS